MLNFLSNNFIDSYAIFTVAVAISVFGITYTMINSFNHMDNVILERQIDTTRVNEGLPTDIALTPEDFRAHPELAEIFEVTDTENNLDLALESQEHLEMLENQYAAVDYNNLMTLYDVIEAFISGFN